MRAFSRIPSAGGGSAGQGYVAGQSNRLTSATYFDAHGVMRVAPPKALRPNYVYKNGVWVRDGWLREGQATNYILNNNPDLGPTKVFPNHMKVAQDAVFCPTISGNISSSQTNLFSVFFDYSHPEFTATWIDFWWSGGGPDGSTLSITDRAIKNPQADGWHAHVDDYGTFLRLSFRGGPPHADVWNGLVIPREGNAIVSCPMMEAYQGNGPSSWTPNQKTRAAD